MKKDGNEYPFDQIPTTNTGELIFNVSEEVPKKGVHVSGNLILNQWGTLLSRKRHEISGSSKQKCFLQQICAIKN